MGAGTAEPLKPLGGQLKQAILSVTGTQQGSDQGGCCGQARLSGGEQHLSWDFEGCRGIWVGREEETMLTWRAGLHGLTVPQGRKRRGERQKEVLGCACLWAGKLLSAPRSSSLDLGVSSPNPGLARVALAWLIKLFTTCCAIS